MKCERCCRAEEAQYRVCTDAIDMKVCEPCAEEAREMGIKVELLNAGKKRPITQREFASAREGKRG